MKVIHLPTTYFPRHVGGKEVFVSEIIKGSPSVEHRVVVHNTSQSSYTHNEIPVDVLPPLSTRNHRYSYFSKIYDDGSVFADYLDQHTPDIVHFHDQNEGASLTHLRECSRRKIKTIVTYHSPGQLCLQRALTFADESPCDGHIDYNRCTSCQYRLHHVPGWMSDILGKLDLPFDRTGRINQRAKTKLFYDSWKEFYGLIDYVQVHALWSKNMMLMNGVPEQKLHYIAMGGSEAISKVTRKPEDSRLHLAFVGRPTHIKGVHLLIAAIKQLPQDAPVACHFFGQGWEDSQYGRDQVAAMKDDSRFMTPEVLPPSVVTKRLSEMDVCVIPSLWPETGPFTVFDAFAAGVPVIGTAHAGIEERVRNNHDGLLFTWGSSDDLNEKIKVLIKDRLELARLRENVRPMKTFKEFAADMESFYHQVVMS